MLGSSKICPLPKKCQDRYLEDVLKCHSKKSRHTPNSRCGNIPKLQCDQRLSELVSDSKLPKNKLNSASGQLRIHSLLHNASYPSVVVTYYGLILAPSSSSARTISNHMHVGKDLFIVFAKRQRVPEHSCRAGNGSICT